MPKFDLEKRKRWEENFKLWETSGLSASVWCEQNNERYSTFKYWRYVLKKRSAQPPIFEELKDTAPARFELWMGEVKIVFPDGCNEAMLENCIRVMRRVQCLR